MTPDIESENSQTTSANADYSTLISRPPTAQVPRLYCQLRLNDQPLAGNVNKPSTEQKLRSNDPVYCEIVAP